MRPYCLSSASHKSSYVHLQRCYHLSYVHFKNSAIACATQQVSKFNIWARDEKYSKETLQACEK